MNEKSPAKRALAILSIILGCLFGLLMLAGLLSGGVTGLLTLVSEILLLATGAYFLWIGIRALRSAEVLQGESGGFGWDRILIGCWTVFSNVNNRYHPAPNLLQASNATQAGAMKATEIAILCGGVGLIVWGIGIGFRRRVPR
jgi:threonine/homoserine/homoserine lactone efflux protein